MKLGKEELTKYRPEIEELYRQYLPDAPLSGLIYFGIIADDVLQAVSALRCYMGTWYLRAAVVKPEFRGRGLQRQLIQEKTEYVTGKTNKLKVSVAPDNIHSIRNIEAEGFTFEKRKKLKNGQPMLVYVKELQ